jgi:hypothetical protein
MEKCVVERVSKCVVVKFDELVGSRLSVGVSRGFRGFSSGAS